MAGGVKRLAIGIVLFVGIGLGMARPALATVVLYTSEPAFVGATSGLTTIDFNGIAAPGSFVSYGGGPLVLSGVTFTGNNSMYVIDPAYYGSPYPGGGFLSSDYSSPNTITASLPGQGAWAVGFNFGNLFAGSSPNFSFALSTGDVFSVAPVGSITGGSLGFAGFVSTTPITSITFTMPDTPTYNAIDNFTFNSVPEPGTLLLLGTGLGAAGLRSRRRRRTS